MIGNMFLLIADVMLKGLIAAGDATFWVVDKILPRR